MNIFLTVVSFIVIFSILVLLHEWGHYIMAKRNGIKVEEFGFGLPPRIWGVKRGETIFSLNLIPFGGFVRLLGEDESDPKVAVNPRSFISKTSRVRFMVVIAGVVMNFLLAFVLLTFGFIVGIQPLIVTGEDVLQGINDGIIQVEPGVMVKEAKFPQIGDIKAGDKILKIDGHEIVTTGQIEALIHVKNKQIALEVLRGKEKKNVQFMVPPEGTGLEFDQLIFLPREVVGDVAAGSAAYNAGLRSGDVILKINDRPVYNYDDFNQEMRGASRAIFMVAREFADILNFAVDFPVIQRAVVSDVFPDTPAEKAGFKAGDVILEINGQNIKFPDDVVSITRKNSKGNLDYKIQRSGQVQAISVHPDEHGLIGISLSILMPYQNQQISVYGKDQPTSLAKINDVRYPIWIAPFKALSEAGRLAVLTVQMFIGVIKSVATTLTIPAGVSGPVGIASMTYTFVQQGILPVLRFMALLSLSLAIINVLPLPALDGGRLLFIIIEVVIGRRLGGKWEALVHTIGFVLLMFLILAVTYSDLLKLF